MKKCVDHIIQYDCPSTLMCATNCASEESINPDNVKIIPFNNYDVYHLRIRICTRKLHVPRYEKYHVIDVVACEKLEDFEVCSRWIPPQTFVPVALPIGATYLEIDKCVVTDKGEQYCLNEVPTRIYGSDLLFPSTYNAPKSNASVCSGIADPDGFCLGSFCEQNFLPATCAPKALRHALESGSKYLSLA
jgi:hypothetical protein